MPQPRTQNELVQQDLESRRLSDEVTDRLSFPDMSLLLEGPPENSMVVTESLKVAALRNALGMNKYEIAEHLMALLKFRRGTSVVGFSWRVDTNSVELKYVNGAVVNQVSSEPELKKLTSFLEMALKTRSEIVAVKWDFGKSFLELTCTVR